MKRKNIIIFIAVLAVTISGMLACIIGFGSLANRLESQKAAERWRGDSELRMSQVSCFLPLGGELEESTVQSFHTTIEAKLQDAAVAAAEEQSNNPKPGSKPDTANQLETEEKGTLYTDAWSVKGELTVTGEKDSAKASALGVGGDFFLFHPLPLRSGSYIWGDDLMRDRVVLDEELAWKLFGSTDVAGMTVTIGDKPYLVAGVVTREKDAASQKAYTDEAGIFVPFELMVEQGAKGLSCYELVMPDPISGFALGVMEESFPKGDGVVIENSTRYDLKNILDIVLDFGERSIQSNGVVYPYWENAARYTEDQLALVLVLGVLCGLLPALVAVIVLVHLVRFLGRKLKGAFAGARNAAEERRYEDYVRKHGDKTNKTVTLRRQTHGKHYIKKHK